MRFLNTETLTFEDVDEPVPKSYAILSHTWGDDEVTFQDMADPEKAHHKAGFDKISKTCRVANLQGFRHAWIDTCCIDKSSSAELSEAINFMFALYAGSGRCFVYLEDYRSGVFVAAEFARCKWFTRGWTLQELIAPDDVQFYQTTWNVLGTKKSLLRHIHDITRIPALVLEDKRAVWGCCLAQRMSWAAGRVTRRPEDAAYCLMGLFGVNMPMLYGIGKKAFLRLQEEIIKDTNDLSIFAWIDRTLPPAAEHGIFAESPDVFKDCKKLYISDGDAFMGHFNMTNRGLRIEAALGTGSDWKRLTSTENPLDSASLSGNDEPAPAPATTAQDLFRERCYFLRLHCRIPSSNDHVGIYIKRQGDGMQFCRIGCDALVTGDIDPIERSLQQSEEIFIAAMPQQLSLTGYLAIDTRSTSPDIHLTVIANFPARRWHQHNDSTSKQCRFPLTARFLGFCLVDICHHWWGDSMPFIPPPMLAVPAPDRAKAGGRGSYFLVAFWLETSADAKDEPFVRCSIHYRQPEHEDIVADRPEFKILTSDVSLCDAQSILERTFPAFGAQQSVYVADVPSYFPRNTRSRSGTCVTVSVPMAVRPGYIIPSTAESGLVSPFQRLCFWLRLKVDRNERFGSI